MVKLAQLVVFMMLGVGMVAATADTTGVSDPDDAYGRLDVARVTHGHGKSSKVLQHRVRTHERWRSRALSNKRSIIYVWFSTDGEDKFGEQRAVIDYKNGRLVACLQIYEEEGDAATVGPCHKIRVWRHGPRRVVIAFDESRLGVSAYKWSVETFFFRSASRSCSSNECEDAAPRDTGRGQITHRM